MVCVGRNQTATLYDAESVKKELKRLRDNGLYDYQLFVGKWKCERYLTEIKEKDLNEEEDLKEGVPWWENKN